MPRIARLVAPDLPHHITQRGNYRQNIFKTDADRRRYLSWIAEYSKRYKLDILSYCLMSNHVHFVAIPRCEYSLAKTFNTSHMRYSQYFNKKMRSYGHLWQGRFFSCILDNNHLLAASRYIERNPVRAGIIKHPADYPWSSAAFHSGFRAEAIINTSALFDYIEIPKTKWQDFIEETDDSNAMNNIRKNTLTGRPLGSDSFIGKLEKRFGVRLHPLAHGRPRKTKESRSE